MALLPTPTTQELPVYECLGSISYLLIPRSGRKWIAQTNALGHTAIIADVVLAILDLRNSIAIHTLLLDQVYGRN
ncbi:uncharacterized protein PAC_12273 [Phialocephala subalpina]|uniref:Uncharacterized protein n=1 Tax=Phialocephala subalpina TaxID=576137 RepID=A0A1L7XBJ9_9HELO|nr:uncharacterized protein PAC_12273 [Phialocephala subalpina]